MRSAAIKKVENQEPDYQIKTGAVMVVESLKKEGVDVVFGYPGGAVIPIYDALYDSGLKHVLSRHEQGAIHAADGYARATGKVGVCIGTSGPGATNLVTGITNAFMDSIPLVVITGQVPRSLVGTDAFQEADITGITMPITKHNYLVQKIEDLPRILKEAFYIARSGRPGPVLVDIPKDVSYEKAAYSYPEEIYLPSYQPNMEPNSSQVEKVAKAIHSAKKPLILAGGGINSANASEQLLIFAEQMNIPVTTTLMGLGGFPANHPLWLGMPGMHGTITANRAIQNADLLISLGARFDDRVTGNIDKFAPKAKVIHVDIDPVEVGKIISVNYPLIGHLKQVLDQLIKVTKPGDTKEWIELLNHWKQEKPLKYNNTEQKIKPQYVIERFSSFSNDPIVSTDVGQHQMWTAQYFKFNNARSIITSGGLGTMGYGLPAAVGAQIGRPDKQVICISGDGSIQMNIQELATIAEQKLPIKLAIINNSYLGMVRQWQQIFHQKRYSSTPIAPLPDFVMLANAYGILGLRATTKEDVDIVIEKALNHDGPVVIDFIVEQEENVFPFVPAGAALDEMIEGGEF